MKTEIRYDNDGTIWGYIDPLKVWIEVESEDAYYEYLESFENKGDD